MNTLRLIFALGVTFASATLSCGPSAEPRGMDAAQSGQAAVVTFDGGGAAGAAEQARSLQDRSQVTLTIDDAWLLVVDSKGAQTGLEPASGTEIRGIPGSTVFVDRIDDDETQEAAESFAVTVGIDRPAEGTYRVVVVGLGRGASSLMVDAFATDGTPQPSIRVPLGLERKSRVEFRLQVLTKPGSATRIESVEQGGPP